MKEILRKLKNAFERMDLLDFIKNNKMLLLMSTLLLSSMIFGTISVNKVSLESIRSLDFLFATDFQERIEQSYLNTFIASMASSFIFVLLMLFFTLSFSGIVIIPLILSFKGLGIGFTAGYLYLIYGLKGIAFHILILLPGIFLSSISLILISIYSLKFSLKYLKKLFPKDDNMNLWAELKLYLKQVSYTMILVCASAVADMGFMFLFSRFFVF